MLVLSLPSQGLKAADTITDEAGNPLDGEKNPGWPSGNGVAGGDFVLQFQMVEALPKVKTTSPVPGSTVSASPGEILITFNKLIDPASVTADTAKLNRPGPDGKFGTSDDQTVAPTAMTFENGNQIRLDLTGIPLADGAYEIWISGAIHWNRPEIDRNLALQGIVLASSLSQDGLELYYSATAPAPLGSEVYVISRPDTASAWTSPTHIQEVSTNHAEAYPCLSADGLELYYASSNIAGFGSYDLWHTQRPDKFSPWGTPVNLATLNSSGSDTHPVVSADGLTLWFASNRGATNDDIYISHRNAKSDPWGAPSKVAELNSTTHEYPEWVSPDSKTMYLTSVRGLGGYDILRATRPDAASPWDAPVNMSNLNSPQHEYSVAVSADESTIYFASARPTPTIYPNAYVATLAPSMGVRDLSGNVLDGDYSSTLPSGNGKAGGDFSGTFTVDRSEMHVTALNNTSGATLSAKPLTLEATLDRDPAPASVNAGTVQLMGTGTDGVIGTDDDTVVTPAGISVVGGDTIKLNLAGVGIPDGPYRWLLSGAAPWRHPVQVPVFNSSISVDRFGAIRSDGLEIFFSTNRDLGIGYGYEIYTSTRADTSSPWSTPTKVTEFSTTKDEITPRLSSDGLTLYFTKIDGGARSFLYSTRADYSSSWNVPVYIACLSSISSAESLVVSPDGLAAWFAGYGFGYDIYTSSRPDIFSGWTTPRIVMELSTNSNEYPTWISADTLTMHLASNRSGTKGGLDIWVTTRASTNSPWSVPVPVPGVNTTRDENDCGKMPDGSAIFFSRAVRTPFATYREDIFTATAGAAILDSDGQPLDGDFAGTLPSGDGQPGGSLAVDFTLNRDPIANDASFGIDKDELLDETLTGSNYAEPQFLIVANGTKGTATVTNSATGAFIYTPNAGELGTDTFTFKINDEGAESNVATVTITINDPPAANDDSANVNEGQTAGINVAGNDTDSDDGLDLASIQIVTSAANGTLQVNNDGTVDYTHDGSENFTDSFTYTIEDTRGSVTGAATVSITINSINDKPVANNDSASVDEGQSVNIGVADNDSDADNALDLTSVQVITGVAHGSLNVKTDGTVDYTHDGSENFTDSFTYTIKDASNAVSSTATVSVTINSVNDAPVAYDDGFTIDEDTPLNDTLSTDDAENDTLTFILVSNPSLGSVAIDPDTGDFTYTPFSNQTGIDTFTFKVNDGDKDSNTATITIDIGAVNDKPVAQAGTLNALEDTAAGGTLSATDADSANLTYSIVSNGSKGTAVVTNASTGAYTYTPNLNANGSDSFNFKANDGLADSDPATITVTIEPVNDKPVAQANSFTTDEDTAHNGTLAATDVDNANLTYSIVSNSSKGTAVVTDASTGAYTYTPSLNANGSDSFTFKANDGAADSTPAAISVTITPVNDKPVANDGSNSTPEDTAVDGTLTGSDVDSAALTFSIVTNGTKGTATITDAAAGAYTYTPALDETGTDTLTFKINDGALDSNTATITVTIGPVNDKPVAQADAFTTDEDTAHDGTLSATDTENDALTYTIVSNGSKGTAVVTDASTGAFTYTPNLNSNGSDSFTFKANDGLADSTPATVSVTITPVNDAPVANNGAVSTAEDVAVSDALLASDVEGNALTYSIVSNGSKGTAVITNASTGAFTYTPNANANGSDSFTFKANDDSADSNSATVTVTISSVNDKPSAAILTAGPVATVENVPFAFAGTGSDIEDGTNVTYAWDWDDGTANGSAQSPSHAWDTPGTYTVTLVVTDQNGLSSTAVTVQVIVTPKVGERDLFLKRGKFEIDWKAHNDGIEKDTFFVQGCLNPAGCNANLNGATFELSVNGVSLGAVPLAANGKGSTANAKASLKAKTGAFSFTIKEADLRAALGLSNTTETGEVELMIEITVPGAGFATGVFAAHAAFAYATTQDVASKGAFNYKLNASSDGYFFAVKTTVAEDKAGAHKVSAKGYVEAPGGASLTPAGNVELEIGAQTITIPATSLTVSGGVISLTKGAHPDLAKFVLDTNKKQFTILTNALAGTGVPPAGVALTSFDLLVRIEIPTAGDPIVLETTVEILR
ncbi:MAG: Ig-like domain-containing protein, partial [Planctomycetes bacterium]|nr:Ig-like domain-containing protein [Planctomycetota bacterium]